MITRNSSLPRGFTLIELLVVIAIIGLLSSIVLTAVNVARYKGYDAQRFSDLRQMQTVLDSYYTDHGSYPVVTSLTWYSVCGTPFTPVAANNVIMNGGTTLVSLGYISAIPVDPQMNSSSGVGCYAYKSNGTDYKFMDYNPPNSVWNNSNEKSFIDPNYGTGVAWSVYSPGGRLF
jgi:prepilin-type N-terminal cleavage/methylation domain-containing protein